MAAVSASASRLNFSGVQLTPFLTNISMPWTDDMLDVTVLQDTSKQFIPGQDTSTISMSGFYDQSTVQAQDNAQLFNAAVIAYFPVGDAAGNPCLLAQAYQTEFTPGAQVGGVVSFDYNCQTTGLTDFGQSLFPVTVQTTTSFTGTTIDNGAASTNGAVGVLWVMAYSGWTNGTVTIRHSTDNFSANDVALISFSTFTAAQGAAYTEVTGTVNRYVRAVGTFTGAGSATIAVAFARR